MMQTIAYTKQDTEIYQCEMCGFTLEEDKWGYEEETNKLICPKCGDKLTL